MGTEARAAVGSEKEPPADSEPAPTPLFAGVCSERNTAALQEKEPA